MVTRLQTFDSLPRTLASCTILYILDIVEKRFIKFFLEFSEEVRPESFIYGSTSKLNLEIRFVFLYF